MLGFFLVQPLMILVQDTATAVLMPKAFRESTPGRLLQVRAGAHPCAWDDAGQARGFCGWWHALARCVLGNC